MTVEEYIREYPSYKNELDAVNLLFQSFEMKVSEVTKGSQIIRYKLLLPSDLNLKEKVRKAEKTITYALSDALNTDAFIYNKSKNYIYIEKKSNDFSPVLFQDHINKLPKNGLYLLLGQGIDGTNMFTNLSKAPHILVAGTTGAGKSELLHTFIASLISRQKTNPCDIYIIDPKISEFSVYKNRKGITLITESAKAVDELKKACDLMDERYRELESHGYKDITQAHDLNMKPIVFVVDELRDLLMQNKNVEHYIVRIAQKARGCGIHLIIGTQTPRKEVVTGAIKANIPVKIAFHTANKMESRIILECNGAENLVGNGDMLFLGNGSFKPIRIQAAYLDGKSKNELAASLPIKIQNNSSQNTYNPQSSLAKYMLKNGYSEEDAKAVDRFKAHMDEKKNSNEEHEPIKQTSSIPQSTPKRKRMGLFQTFRNLMNVKPLMFVTSEYPPRI